ncbi:9344_t:CDS:2 [Diversispora eburnea]|uniref:9344_t:CDS:1 n=1 Tax=Diversispora eburnea TaxID=1213867 RepID=A0A9N9FS15_9GLOM|nr:9344_t:CDS:2 [Diversispora eburnea]
MCIKFVDKSDDEKFSHNLVAILARDREVVAKYLRIISEYEPMLWMDAFKRDDTKDLIFEVVAYCSAKFNSIFGKLKKDLKEGKDEQYVKSFIKYVSNHAIDINKKNIIQRFIPDPKDYDDFKNTCFIISVIANRLVQIYSSIGNLDFENINKRICISTCRNEHSDPLNK